MNAKIKKLYLYKVKNLTTFKGMLFKMLSNWKQKIISATIYKNASTESVFLLTILCLMFSSTTCMCCLLLQICSWHTFHVLIFFPQQNKH